MNGSSPAWIARTFATAAAAYVAAALAAAWAWSPRVPYADAWRHYARLIDKPFAQGVLAADNGHPEVFANVVRWISLHGMQGNEDVQIAIGLLMAVATLGTLLRIVWTNDGLAATERAAATLAIALGIFWLGNARALLHDNETLDVYSVLVCLALALVWMLRSVRDSVSLWPTIGATLLCFVASFNFGSGIAAFVALSVVLFIERAAWPRWLVVGMGIALSIIGYRMLAGNVLTAPAWQPMEQVTTALRWVAAPLMYLFWPFVDPAIEAALPSPFNRLGIVARGWTAVFGDVRSSVFPQAACGAAFVAVVVHSTWKARRASSAGSAVQTLGLALAWFGIAVSGLIALTRVDYFATFPGQVYAPRYLPWSSLAWAGWLVALVAEHAGQLRMRVVVAAVALLALSAEVGMTRAMRHLPDIAADTALAAVVGVSLDKRDIGESEVGDVLAGATAMKRLHAGRSRGPRLP